MNKVLWYFVNIGSGNGLVSGRPQAITWTNEDLLSVGPVWINLNQNVNIYTPAQQSWKGWGWGCVGVYWIHSFRKMHLKISFAKCHWFYSHINIFKLFNSSWPSDAIWSQRSRSLLAQVMVCCLAAPSHYPNRYRLVKFSCILIATSPKEQWVKLGTMSSFTSKTINISPSNIPWLITWLITYPFLPFRWSSSMVWETQGKCLFGFYFWGNLIMSIMQSYQHARLIHWGRDKMATIFQTIFSNAFSWMKIYSFRLRCHWSLFLRV